MPPEIYAALTLADKHWRLVAKQRWQKSGRQYPYRDGKRKHLAKAMKLTRRAALLMSR